MRPFFDKVYGKGDSYQKHLNRKPPSVNPGQDVLTPIGKPIYAPTTCSVQALIDQNGGKYLNIEYQGNKWQLVHLSAFGIKGPTVLEGSIIGYTGNTGNSTGPHTHATLFINGKRVDPMLHFPELLFPISNLVTSMATLPNGIILKCSTTHTGTLNIRKLPTSQSEDIGDVPVGTKFDCTEIADGEVVEGIKTWYKFQNGWITGAWVKIQPLEDTTALKATIAKQKSKIDGAIVKAQDLVDTLKA